MEIRDPIHGSIEITPAEAAVVDHPFFQRLRHIKQLGFGEMSFPGATHNRYIHSLGAMHLAGFAFDAAFRGFAFSKPEVRWRLRQTLRLACLLHDVGHGPLSHTTEEVMPPLKALNLSLKAAQADQRATHEDYTLKIVTDSDLTSVLRSQFADLSCENVAELIDSSLPSKDDFFKDQSLDLRPLLSQLVSSELDVDRMDYLARDSYYCGTSYGHVDRDWLLSNLTYYENKGSLNLALNRRALFTFDDFLISRFHMYLMVYFHHKSVIYDELLLRYLRSPDCDFRLPSDIKEYLKYDDYKLHSQMSLSANEWAKLISRRQPYRMVFEIRRAGADETLKLLAKFENEGLRVIRASSTGRLSRYYSPSPNEITKSRDSLFVIDDNNGIKGKVSPIEESTEVFEKYREARSIERLYVHRDDYRAAESLLKS